MPDGLMVCEDDATLLLQLVGAEPSDIMHVTLEEGQRFFFERSIYCSHYDVRKVESDPVVAGLRQGYSELSPSTGTPLHLAPPSTCE